jgi:hypothetical protein
LSIPPYYCWAKILTQDSFNTQCIQKELQPMEENYIKEIVESGGHYGLSLWFQWDVFLLEDTALYQLLLQFFSHL